MNSLRANSLGASRCASAILIVACQSSGVIYPSISYAQSLVCPPASESELRARLSRPNNYVLLKAIYPNGQTHEVVLHSDVLPIVVKSKGVIEWKPAASRTLLSEAEVNALLAAPIKLEKPLGKLTTDLAPHEQCALGGVVESLCDGIVWESNTTLENVLVKFFEPVRTNDGRLVGYALRRDVLSRLKCADIAALLKCNLSVKRSPSWWTIVVEEQGSNLAR